MCRDISREASLRGIRRELICRARAPGSTERKQKRVYYRRLRENLSRARASGCKNEAPEGTVGNGKREESCSSLAPAKILIAKRNVYLEVKKEVCRGRRRWISPDAGGESELFSV